MAMTSGVVVIGAGWIGRAVAVALNVEPIPRRGFRGDELPHGASVVVASGRSSVSAGDGTAASLRKELAHLRLVLDAAARIRAPRVLVVGSSDVAGMAPEIDGQTPQDPRTTYAEVKSALEDECVLRHSGGLSITCVRLAPVHGAGKDRTEALIKLSRLPVLPLPNGGSHSTGFILLADAVRAITWLAQNPAPPVQAVGAGHTRLRDLLSALATAQQRHLRVVPVPVPDVVFRTLDGCNTDRLQWALRLASPRAVLMEPPLEATPLTEAARMLVDTC